MECIDNYLSTVNATLPVERVIYKLLTSKEDTKNLRDRMIVEYFDKNYFNNSAESSYTITANHFGCSIHNVKYIVKNRCLL